MLRCLLVGSYEEPPRSFIKPPLGLVWLKKSATNEGLPVSIEIVDPQLATPAYAKKRIEEQWDVVGFYATYPTLMNSVSLIIHAWLVHSRRSGPRPFIIAGGPGVAFSQIMDIAPLDMVAIGESEKLWVEFLRTIIESDFRPPIKADQLDLFAKLPGNYRLRYSPSEDNVTTLFSHTAKIADSTLSTEELGRLLIPLPWELDMHLPYADWTQTTLNHSYGFPIYATRGCSQPGCLFCSSFKSISSRGGTRAPTPSSLLETFRIASRAPLKARSFILEDDTFVWDRQWMVEVCNMVTYAKIRGVLPQDVTFVIKSRVDHFDENLIRLMLRAGFCQINVGIESGSPTVLRQIAKVADPSSYLQQASKVLRWITDYGLRVHAYMLFFTPESTLDDLVLTMELAAELLMRGAEISTYETVLALPGSPYEQLWKRGRVILDEQVVENPLVAQATDITADGQTFVHPALGRLPRTVSLPNTLLPSDPQLQDVLHSSQLKFPESWANFTRRLGWQGSTSARDGFVRIWTYLDVLRDTRATAAYSDRLEHLRSRLSHLMAHLGREQDQLPENQSCSNHALFETRDIAPP
jgi:radical SAM superfamily enzyme YgiQ (UPF0313 family)